MYHLLDNKLYNNYCPYAENYMNNPQMTNMPLKYPITTQYQATDSMYYERLTPENSVIMLVDFQEGLIPIVGDIDPINFKNNIIALAKAAKIFNLPTILITSFSEGLNGPLMRELRTLFPNEPVIDRRIINAWEDERVRTAVKRTGRRKIIIAGILTDVCVVFPALSAVAEGYDVYAVIDASGTVNLESQRVTLHRLTQAGVIPTTWFATSFELQNNWNIPQVPALREVYTQHLSSYGRTCSD